jgi:hypothetical protein
VTTKRSIAAKALMLIAQLFFPQAKYLMRVAVDGPQVEQDAFNLSVEIEVCWWKKSSQACSQGTKK